MTPSAYRRGLVTRGGIDSIAPSLPRLGRVRTLIALGTVGLVPVVAAPAGAEDGKPTTTKKKVATVATPAPVQGTYQVEWVVRGPVQE